MPERARWTLAFRFAVLRLGRSPSVLAPSLALAACGAWLGLRGAHETALAIVVPLLPHVFLLATQDAFKSGSDPGAYESVLFVGGEFRGHALRKSAVLVLVGLSYGLFVLAVSGGVPLSGLSGAGRFGGPPSALAAGIYYVALGGLLGVFIRGGANVLVIIVAQSGAFIGLVADLSGGHGFLDALTSGVLRTPADGLKLAALAAVLPNVLIASPLRRFAPCLVPAAAALFLAQAAALRRTEVGRR